MRLLLIIAVSLCQITSFAEENFEYKGNIQSELFTEEFRKIEKKIRADERMSYRFLQERANRYRDRGLDLTLADFLQNNPTAIANKDIFHNLLATMRVQHSTLLLETTTLINEETATTKERKSLLKSHNEVLFSHHYHFTKQYMENARLFYNGSSTVNAYSFTGYPQTLYYEGLVEALNTGQLKGVIAHELGHAVSKHVDHSVELYSYLLAGGYFMFSDSAGRSSKKDLIESLKRNKVFMATKVDPENAHRYSEISTFEAGIVKHFSQFAGTFGSKDYTERMFSFIDTMEEAAVNILRRSSVSKEAEFALEELIYDLESIIINEDRIERRVWINELRQKKKGRVKTRLSSLFNNANEFFAEISRGMMDLSQSYERTADTYGMIVAGKKNNQEVEAIFMGGKLYDVEAAKIQREILKKDQRKFPGRVEQAKEGWLLSHPTPLQRIENLEIMERSFQYKMINERFLVAYRDFLDFLPVYSQIMQELKVEIPADVANQLKEVDRQIEMVKHMLQYLDGKSETYPEDLKELLEEAKSAPERIKNELDIAIKQMELSKEQVLQGIGSTNEETEKYRPKYEYYIKRYGKLLNQEIKRMLNAKNQKPWKEMSSLMIEIFNDWSITGYMDSKDVLSGKHGFAQLFAGLNKKQQERISDFTEKLEKALRKAEKDAQKAALDYVDELEEKKNKENRVIKELERHSKELRTSTIPKVCRSFAVKE